METGCGARAARAAGAALSLLCIAGLTPAFAQADSAARLPGIDSAAIPPADFPAILPAHPVHPAHPAENPGVSRPIADSAVLELSRLMAGGYLRAARGQDGTVAGGPLFKLGDIRVLSAPGFTAEELGIAAFTGEPAAAETFQAIGGRIKAYLLDHGHPFAVVAVDFAVREDRAVADLAVSIQAGDGYKYGGFKHSGSCITPEAL